MILYLLHDNINLYKVYAIFVSIVNNLHNNHKLGEYRKILKKLLRIENSLTLSLKYSSLNRFIAYIAIYIAFFKTKPFLPIAKHDKACYC